MNGAMSGKSNIYLDFPQTFAFNTPMFNFSPIQLAWLAAIESDEFNQGTCKLTSVNGTEQFHCCLGVACVVYNRMNDALKLVVNDIKTAIVYDHQAFYAPWRVVEALRLRDEKGKFAEEVTLVYNSEPHLYISLADMNDGGLSFKEIANYIRQNPENVFKS